MDRRSALKHAGIAGVLAAGAAPAVQAQQVLRFRLASSFPKSLDTLYGGSELFAKKVKELSGGKFEICEITIRTRNLKKEQFIMDADFTPSGVARIGALQARERFAYIKP